MPKRNPDKRLLTGIFAVVGLLVIAGFCASAAVDYSGPSNRTCGPTSDGRYRCQDTNSSNAVLKALVFIPDDDTRIDSSALLWTARVILLAIILGGAVAWFALPRKGTRTGRGSKLKPRKKPLP